MPGQTVEGTAERLLEASGPQGSSPSPATTQRLTTVPSLGSHCTWVPEQSLAVSARKPVMHQRIKLSQEQGWGWDLLPLGHASVTPLSPTSTPGRTRKGTSGSGFHRLNLLRGPWVWDALLPQTQALRPRTALGAPAQSPARSLQVTIRRGADKAAAGLAALAVAGALVVQGALLHTVRTLWELGAHAWFLCSGACA